MAGLGWESTLLPLKILRADGLGTHIDLAAAIRYAADQGADVINMSLGAPNDDGCPESIQDAVDYAHGKGVVLVAAAGNHSGGDPATEMFPANCDHVLGVAATEADDSVAEYSNYGTHVSVAAPGSGIYSTLMNNLYGTKWGTSMAAPHVAALAALLRAQYPSYAPDQIASAILDNAEDLGPAGWDPQTGCGRIDAARALLMGTHGGSPACLDVTTPRAVGAGGTSFSTPFVPGEVIVSFRPGVGMAAMPQQYSSGAEFLPTVHAWRLHVPPGQEQTVLSQLRTDPAVAYAELNYVVSVQ